MKIINKILTFIFIFSLLLSSNVKIKAQEDEVTNTESTTTTEVVEQPTEATTEEASTVPATSVSEGEQPVVAEDSATEEAAVEPTVAFRSASATNATAPVSVGTVTFVHRGGEKTVNFENMNELIGKTDADGNKGNDSDQGGGASKAYFLFWSTADNYPTSGKAFYPNESISSAFPEGIPANAKLHAVYWDVARATSVGRNLSGKISINRDVDTPNTMYNEFPNEVDVDNANDLTRTYYVPNDIKDQSYINLNSEFVLDPIMNAAARWSPTHSFTPGSFQYYGKWDDIERVNLPAPTQANPEYTYIDLVVELDQRLTIADTLSFAFESYSFRPLMIMDENYTRLESVITKTAENPSTDIEFKTAGNKKFIIRTVLRGIEEIPNAPAEVASKSDMRLISKSNTNFSLSKEEIIKIAKGETNPVEIKGHIQGSAKLYETTLFGFLKIGGVTPIPKTTAKTNLLNYAFLTVEFNKNTGATDGSDRLGSSVVAYDSSLSEDFLKEGIKPSVDVIGDEMHDDLTTTDINGETLYFKEWNTMADGTGESFSGTTVVRNNQTVYAVWAKKFTTQWVNEKGEALKPEVMDFDVKESGTIANYQFDKTVVNGSITTHIFKKVVVVTPAQPVNPTPTPTKSSLPAMGHHDMTSVFGLSLLALAGLFALKRK